MIPIEDLHRHFFILDGEVFWRKTSGPRSSPGMAAGNLTSHGYVELQFRGKKIKSHRLVFAMTHGRWPSGEVDHINGVRTDNRPENLREVTKSQNQQNRHSIGTTKTGCIGVTFCRTRKRWVAAITMNKMRKHLGYFHSIDEAAAARWRAEQQFFTHAPQRKGMNP